MGTSDSETQGSISARLQMATVELQVLEQLIESEDFDSRVLRDFRGAVDNVRMSAWGVQQWTELRHKGGDPYTVLPVLGAERVRRTAQLAKDVELDLETFELSVETEGLRDLFQAIEGLHTRLAHLFRGKG